jgi:hypothetical protein
MSFEHFVTNLPAFATYAEAGVIPADADLLAAAKEHATISDRVRDARIAVGDADAWVMNAAHLDDVAVRDAIEAGTPDEEIHKLVNAEQTRSAEAASKARTILGAFRLPVLTRTGAVLSAAMDCRPEAQAGIDAARERRVAQVEKLRQQLAKAEQGVYELDGLRRWFDAVTMTNLPDTPYGVRLAADGSDEA